MAQPTEAAKEGRFQQRRGPVLAWALAALLTSTLGLRLSPLRFNHTRSLPRGLYRLTHEPLRRGDLVSACLPQAVSDLGRRRGYLHSGVCPSGVEPVLKRILAVPGDTVDVDVRGLSLNGVPIEHSASVQTDHLGRPLTSFPSGFYHLGRSDYWLLSTYDPMSWDSRYFGPIERANILSTVRPVWLLDPP